MASKISTLPHSLDLSLLSVVVGEDDLVFQSLTETAFAKAGLPKENVRLVVDGIEALEVFKELQAGSGLGTPVLVLLDLRMPRMDGNQCAGEIRALEASGSLRRPAFLVLCSAAFAHVSTDLASYPKFNVVFPKPFQAEQVEQCLSMLADWWSLQADGLNSPLAESLDRPVATASMDASEFGSVKEDCESSDDQAIDVVIATSEMMCAMGISMQLSRLGLDQKAINIADSVEEATELVEEAQSENSARPLLVLLEHVGWLEEITGASTEKRRPFVVCTSVDADRLTNKESFHATLPWNFQQEHLSKILEMCRQWWRQQVA